MGKEGRLNTGFIPLPRVALVNYQKESQQSASPTLPFDHRARAISHSLTKDLAILTDVEVEYLQARFSKSGGILE